MEMIILTYEPRVKIISWRDVPDGLYSHKYTAYVESELSLLSHLKMRKGMLFYRWKGISVGRHPIALAAQYIDFSKENTKDKQFSRASFQRPSSKSDYSNFIYNKNSMNQDTLVNSYGVIVIITEEWEVLCLNEHLRLLWTVFNSGRSQY